MRYLLIILLFACGTSKPVTHTPHPPEYDVVLVLSTWPISYQLRNGWIVTEKEYSDVLLGRYKPKVDTIIPPAKDTTPSKIVDWPDRRAIGMVMLANFKEWTGTDNYMNEGVPFEEWIVSNAHNIAATLKSINAQGFIVWDSEGQKFPHPYSYIGDPRLTPERIDTFFTILKAAGFRAGVTLRPDEIRWEGGWPKHYTTNPLPDLVAKIDHARKKWGCTLFYVDSNVGVGLPIGVDNSIGAGQLMPSMLFAALHEMYPDCLFIPEWHNKEYEPYSALYWHKSWSNNTRGLAVIDCGDTWWSQEWLNNSVRQGHILMGRVFWNQAPELERIKLAYESITARD